MSAAVLGYAGAHQRVKELFGKATEYECIDCGEQAEHWCYNNAGGAREVVSGSGLRNRLRYSLNPLDYDPRCHKCHRLFDDAYRRLVSEQKRIAKRVEREERLAKRRTRTAKPVVVQAMSVLPAIGLMALTAAAVVLTPNAQAAPPDVENRFVTLVQQQTGTTADRATILSAAYDDVCGPVRQMTAFDLGNRLGINPITQAGMVTAIAIHTGLCF